MPNLLLIGLRGSGKSTIGGALALHERRTFLDLDDLTPAILNCMSVAEAWRAHGEPAFRRAETEALTKTLAEHSGAIVALGGGTPTAPGAAELIERSSKDRRAIVAYLRETPQTLADRLRSIPGGPGASRPSLTGADPVEEIAAVFAIRDPLYCRLATRVLENHVSLEGALAVLQDWPSW